MQLMAYLSTFDFRHIHQINQITKICIIVILPTCTPKQRHITAKFSLTEEGHKAILEEVQQ